MTNKTIWKYEIDITDEQIVRLPKGAEILHADQQYPGTLDKLQIWVLIDSQELHFQDKKIYIYETGHPIETVRKYVGTVLANNDALVWHVYQD